MLEGNQRILRSRRWSFPVFGIFFIATQFFSPNDQVIYANDSQSNEPSQLKLQLEPLDPFVIASGPTPRRYERVKRGVTLFDLYFDEERPFIIGQASTSLEESVELLASYHEAHLLVETYCDRRNTAAYGMALSHQRTWQVKEFLDYLDIQASRVMLASYGKEGIRCREESTTCWEEKIRVQSAFKYLAISQPKLGCLVRLGILGVNKDTLPPSSAKQVQFLQKIKLAPIHDRRRLRRYVSRPSSPSSSHSVRTTALR